MDAKVSASIRDLTTLHSHKETVLIGIYQCGDATPYKFRVAHERLKALAKSMTLEQILYKFCSSLTKKSFCYIPQQIPADLF